MALNTPDKRAAAMGIPGRVAILPIPDNDIGANDRRHLLGLVRLATVVNGPYTAAAGQIRTPGAITGQVFTPGPVAGQIRTPGAITGEAR